MSNLLDKVGIAGRAGVQITATWQGWAGAPETVMLVVAALPCSGILHSCLAGRSDRRKQATVPTRGWSWNSSKNAAKTAIMSGTLSTIDLMSKGVGPIAEAAIDFTHGRGTDQRDRRDPASIVRARPLPQ